MQFSSFLRVYEYTILTQICAEEQTFFYKSKPLQNLANQAVVM